MALAFVEFFERKFLCFPEFISISQISKKYIASRKYRTKLVLSKTPNLSVASVKLNQGSQKIWLLLCSINYKQNFQKQFATFETAHRNFDQFEFYVNQTLKIRHVWFRDFLFNSIPIQFEGMNCNSILNQFNARRIEISKTVTWKSRFYGNIWFYGFGRSFLRYFLIQNLVFA